MSYELQAEAREPAGKGAARALRRNGRIPAIVYGGKEPPMAISLPEKEVTMKLHGGGFMTTVATIDVGGRKIRVLPKDYQLDPVRDFTVHVDFLRIGRDTVVTVEVPVQFIHEDEAPGIKRGGVLNVVRHVVEVTCPANRIPEAFVADLTGFDLGGSLHISSVTLPEGVKPTIADRDFTIATIAAPAGLKSDMYEEREDSETDEEGDRED